jgi:hypothetical protein
MMFDPRFATAAALMFPQALCDPGGAALAFLASAATNQAPIQAPALSKLFSPPNNK